MDDIVGGFIAQNGPFNPDAEYVGKYDDTWFSVPTPIGSRTFPMVSRVDYFKLHAGIDIKKIFPAGPDRSSSLVSQWNYNNLLDYAAKLYKVGHPIGNQIGLTSEAQDWLGPLFASFGAVMVDAHGKITVNSDETRTALEYLKKLTRLMPAEVYAWDDASNNQWIISGKGSAIQNSPSAWTLARREQPDVAAQIWHHDTPTGPKGRFRGSKPRMLGVWNFSKNIPAAKDLLYYLIQKEQTGRLILASQGWDMPPHRAYNANPIWAEIGPPKGSLYNYPIRGNEFTMVSGYPAPTDIAASISTQAVIPNLVARVTHGGETFDKAIKWAENELEGILAQGPNICDTCNCVPGSQCMKCIKCKM